MSVRSCFARLAAAALLVLLGAQSSYSQRIEPVVAGLQPLSTDGTSHESLLVDNTRRPLLTWGGVGGAVLGGGAGVFGGMFAGVASAHVGTCAGEDCSLGAALAGAAVGEAVGVAVGAHLGSGRRGNVALAVLTSVGIGAVGAIALSHPSAAAPVVALSIPVLQLATVLAVER